MIAVLVDLMWMFFRWLLGSFQFEEVEMGVSGCRAWSEKGRFKQWYMYVKKVQRLVFGGATCHRFDVMGFIAAMVGSFKVGHSIGCGGSYEPTPIIWKLDTTLHFLRHVVADLTIRAFTWECWDEMRNLIRTADSGWNLVLKVEFYILFGWIEAAKIL